MMFGKRTYTEKADRIETMIKLKKFRLRLYEIKQVDIIDMTKIVNESGSNNMQSLQAIIIVKETQCKYLRWSFLWTNAK